MPFFPQFSQSIWIKFDVLPWPFGLFKLILIAGGGMISIQGSELHFSYFVENMFKTGLSLDEYEPIF